MRQTFLSPHLQWTVSASVAGGGGGGGTYLESAVQRPGYRHTLRASILAGDRLLQIVQAVTFTQLFHERLDRLLRPFLLLLGLELTDLPAQEALLYGRCEWNPGRRCLQEVFNDSLTARVHLEHLSHHSLANSSLSSVLASRLTAQV